MIILSYSHYSIMSLFAKRYLRPITPVLLPLLLLSPLLAFAQNPVRFHVVWEQPAVEGEITVHQGTLAALETHKGKIRGNGFRTVEGQPARITAEVSEARLDPGPEPTRITVRSTQGTFTFILRDVNQEHPIFIPLYKAAVLADNDPRTYAEVEKDVLKRKLATKIQQIESAEEVSFASVAPRNRNMSAPIWLGIGRDMRMFEVTEELQDYSQEGKIIRAKYSSSYITLKETNQQAAFIYVLGRGVGPQNNIQRRLDKGYLPIYHSTLTDDDVVYHSTSFVSFGKKPLTADTNRGTHFVVSDKHSYGRSFKDEHKQELEERMKSAYDFDDPMVYYCQTVIENAGSVPRYAWLKTPRPGTGWWYQKIHDYNPETGFSTFDGEKVFCISKFNGKPLPNEEMAVLLKPGEKAVYEFYLPHTPIATETAAAIAGQSFPQRLEEARNYWENRMAQAANIRVPEKRIEEMLKAGLLHLDLITFGEEPQGTLSANIGVYSPIGTESSPIIQYYLSMGWFDQARRALNYFLDTQLSTGYIQNFEGYTVETGAALWNMGEYIRYTGDLDWLKQAQPRIMKSVNYLLQWREKNKKEELKGRGYGMIDGKVADPEDHFHQFMLNGYAFLGLSRMGEVLTAVDPATADKIRNEAAEWKKDILETVATLWKLSPVVPMGDGTWVPTLPPWAEADGPRNLFLKKETFWSHGTFTGADAMLGPIYLAFCEVLDPYSDEAGRLLQYHSELMYQGNSAFSQPYYSRHNWLQAKRGMVKPFLSTYYNTMAAHADRETYTFWEHMYRLSPHKTHEEGWFLMETRWMLYMEDGDTLSLFKTIPRDWLQDGREIALDGVRSYFGKINVKLNSKVNSGFIEVEVSCPDAKRPRMVTVRVPHPDHKRPVRVSGGTYDPTNETVTLLNFTGQAKLRLDY